MWRSSESSRGSSVTDSSSLGSRVSSLFGVALFSVLLFPPILIFDADNVAFVKLPKRDLQPAARAAPRSSHAMSSAMGNEDLLIRCWLPNAVIERDAQARIEGNP